MVAITVILAAVIGAFVLEIGDQQETAPSTSFDTGHLETYHGPRHGNMDYQANWSWVQITHNAGDNIALDNFEFVVEGNENTLSPIPSEQRNLLTGDTSGNHFVHMSNEPTYTDFKNPGSDTEFRAGQTFLVWGQAEHDLMYNDGKKITTCFASVRRSPNTEELSNVKCWPERSNFNSKLLQSGHDVSTVWRASSGGKTQNLYTYTVP